MYEDSWYSFVPSLGDRKGGAKAGAAAGHKRKESLLQQSNSTHKQTDSIGQLSELFEEEGDANSPAEPTVPRRARSFNDFRSAVRPFHGRHGLGQPPSKAQRSKVRSWEALLVDGPVAGSPADDEDAGWIDDGLLEYSQREHILYSDQLALTERHLDSLIEDTNEALKLLSLLSESFKTVEQQTTSFQAQCDDLISEQKRLQQLADEVGSDLHYYTYLDNITRRVNAPGASRLVDDEVFGEIVDSIDSCISFMTEHPTYRDADSYLARYRSVLTRALHLLEQGFTARLEKVSAEISKQIASTQSEASRHAIAYGRFLELVLRSDALIPNVQTIVRKTFDRHGNPTSITSFDIYSNTVSGMFRSYLTIRDRDLKPVIVRELEQFKSDVKASSAETASRNFVKLSFERAFEETALFSKIFGITPHFSTDSTSASALISGYQRALVNVANIKPIAVTLQSVLSAANLGTLTSVVGWLANEYLIEDYEDEDTDFMLLCRELAARLLSEHLWPYTDAAVEVEVSKSITKATIAPESLKIGPVVNGVASSNAHPIVKRALELLTMYDQAMPKERSQKSSPVIFAIVRETIAAMQRAESRIKSLRNGTDADLFMVKNLLILKNELVSLEMGDIRAGRGGSATSSAGGGTMQHFGAIWGAMNPVSWVGFVGGYVGSFIWSSSSGNKNAQTGNAAAAVEPDISSQLDDLLRRSIYAFTERWGALLSEARGGATGGRAVMGGKNVARIERDLDTLLQNAFGGQPEVVAKLKEAIEINARAQSDARAGKKR